MALKMIRKTTRTLAPRIRPPVKLTDPFYQSADWRALAADIKRQRRYRCEACGSDFSRRADKLIADHIVERRAGGAEFDPLNIQCLCIACHNRKTARARKARKARQARTAGTAGG
ncbi:HNH endonuclease [Roseibium sp.]|uniref:HNH endonuclease n=1 Tax=Roseibium sp. TaxID=1936156 RepID=UPI003B508B26